MVKTTIILDDNIYKELIDESIERYGTTKKLSLLINEKLRNYNKIKNTDNDKLKLTYRLGRKLTNAEINQAKEEYRGKTEWKQ
ncbi:hypothetical protein [Acidiplasma sp.]|uniref:hypothetical protein n=1 Tax=Acidiplasma sp. TaxID=1872114 RepID=UPI0025847178|nr:hypothetical protein [Acidiplasma sp.]